MAYFPGSRSFCVISIFLWITPTMGHRSWPKQFSSIPIWSRVYLTVLVVQESFCQFPVNFQRELFYKEMDFWCVHGGRSAPCSLTQPSWSRAPSVAFLIPQSNSNNNRKLWLSFLKVEMIIGRLLEAHKDIGSWNKWLEKGHELRYLHIVS